MARMPWSEKFSPGGWVISISTQWAAIRRIRWPRIETADHIMVAASIRPLVDAMRIAYVELIEWLVADYGFDKMEAFQVASQVGEVRVANIVDPNYTVVAKFPKRLLPPRQRR